MDDLNKKIKEIFLNKNLPQDEKNKKIQELYNQNFKKKRKLKNVIIIKENVTYYHFVVINM